MSWDGYVSNLEQGKAKCRYAAIYGRQGGCWAESKSKTDFPVSPDEVSTMSRAVENQDLSIMGTGVQAGGKKFTCIRMEPDILVCQGKGDQKECSLVVGLSNQAVIIGFNPEPEVKTNQVRDCVEGMKDYLKNAGY